jgi:PHP family Zn ribbon phosphoesterase
MRREGCTFKEISERFHTSGERIRQICESQGINWKRSSTYVANRDIAPYLAQSLKHFCVRCGNERNSRNNLCPECKKKLKIVRTVKSRLRSYLDGSVRGKIRVQALRNALSAIRKYNLTPEDLKLI